jgi:tRNA A37 threonylcarbamoyladenosine dehydratase
MSPKQINRNEDLKKLRNEGFSLSLRGTSLLLVSNIPYVTSKKEVKRGTLVIKLDLANDVPIPPESHVAYWIGDQPHNHDGSLKAGIVAGGGENHGSGVISNFTFSCMPQDKKYSSYYQKVLSYHNILAAEAKEIEPEADGRVFDLVQEDDADVETVFHYANTSVTRAAIDDISAKARGMKVGIVGLGGTGSYILDLIVKCEVREIHLFDKDVFFQHNAFRSPGAADGKKLEEKPKKVEYHHSNYSKLHKYIIPHAEDITQVNLNSLDSLDFVFVAIDPGPNKRLLIDHLIRLEKTFIDVGISVSKVDDKLIGSVRVTSVNSAVSQTASLSIPCAEEEHNDYSHNIQIAELNALNAALAVIRWKKHIGMYHDFAGENYSLYDLNANKISLDVDINP